MSLQSSKRRSKLTEVVSTGIRFTTIPPILPLSPNTAPPSPPTTLTLLYNPLIGFLSSAYSAQVAPTVALSTRFGINVYSYESDLSIGGEWWIGRSRGKRDLASAPGQSLEAEGLGGERELEDAKMEEQLDSPFGLRTLERDQPVSLHGEIERDGVLKARMSGDWVCLRPPPAQLIALTSSRLACYTKHGSAIASSRSVSSPISSHVSDPSEVWE